MELTFSAEIWYWRGPSPWYFVTVPSDEAALLAELAPAVTYGWGMVPAAVRIGRTEVRTALWPKDGGYVVPLKSALRTAQHLEVGDVITVQLRIGG